DDHAAGDAAARLRSAGAGGDAVLLARDRRGGARGGYRPGVAEARARPLRRRAVDRGAPRADRARASGGEGRELLRAVRDVRTRRGGGVLGGSRWASRARGPLPGGGRRR